MESGIIRASVGSRLGLAFLVAAVFAMTARADFGPKPNDRQTFSVTLEGDQLPDVRFVAAMLCQRDRAMEGPQNMGAVIPGLEETLPPEDSDGRWTNASYRWGGKGSNGQVQFNGFYGDVPKVFRVAVYLPSREKVFLSNESTTHPLLNRYTVDLASDGTATLTRNESGRWLADPLVGLAQRGILFALAVTLVVETLVVGSVVTALKKREVRTRMAATCAVANLITLPALWVICLIGFWMGGLWTGLLIFAVQEIAVVLLEASLYATLGRIGWRPAFGVALVANAASFLLGIALG